jgi:hypothetical protein
VAHVLCRRKHATPTHTQPDPRPPPPPAHKHTHTQTHIDQPTHTRARPHAHTHSPTHAHARTHTHTHAHAHARRIAAAGGHTCRLAQLKRVVGVRPHRPRSKRGHSPHLRRDWAHPPATSAPGLDSLMATSAPGLGSPADHICTGTGLTPQPTSAPGLGPPLPQLHRDQAWSEYGRTPP